MPLHGSARAVLKRDPRRPNWRPLMYRTLYLAALLVLALGFAPEVQAAPKAAPQTISIEVTSDGFVPAAVTAKAGRPVKLVVTRKVERTCATEIVMKDLGVNQPLPLGKPVT